MPYPATSKIGGVANTDREGWGSINRINIEGERKTGGMRSGRDTEASSILNASKPSGVPASQNSLRLQPSYPTAATREKGWRFPRWLLCRKRYRALLGHTPVLVPGTVPVHFGSIPKYEWWVCGTHFANPCFQIWYFFWDKHSSAVLIIPRKLFESTTQDRT